MSTTKNLFRLSQRLLVLLGLLVVILPEPLRADSVKQMNLSEMCQGADKIFRGSVLSATPGTLTVGGGQLPIVTYRLWVDEAFKGDFQTIKGIRFTEVRMLGMPKSKVMGQARFQMRVDGLPQLEVGKSYLLLTTRPSSIGMSSPVGLGQGCFHISGKGAREDVVNEAYNRMLFRGMESEGTEANGPLKYSHLAGRIRNLVSGERRGQ